MYCGVAYESIQYFARGHLITVWIQCILFANDGHLCFKLTEANVIWIQMKTPLTSSYLTVVPLPTDE